MKSSLSYGLRIVQSSIVQFSKTLLAFASTAVLRFRTYVPILFFADFSLFSERVLSSKTGSGLTATGHSAATREPLI
jgi:hypothetical protein